MKHQILALLLGAAFAAEPEKVHVLEPEVYNVYSNNDFPSQRTAFYLQESEAPEKVHILEPKIARQHTTFYDKKNGVWRTNGPSLSQQIINPVGMDHDVHRFSSENTDLAQKQDVGETGIHHDVHEFSYWNTDALPYIKRDSTYDPNGSGPQAHKNSLSQYQSYDISKNGVRSDVWSIVDESVNPVAGSRSSTAPEARHDNNYDYSNNKAYGRNNF